MNLRSIVPWLAGSLLMAGALGGAVADESDAPQRDYQVPLPEAPAGEATFQPPAEADIPDTPYGDMVRLGRDLFLDTQRLRDEYVFNDQNCSNCHLDAGRLANSAPMWASVGMYPAYRGKNDKVNTMAERIQGCFTYSMNGIPPEYGSEPLVALQTYFHWLATGAPINESLPGRGYPGLEEPAQAPDRGRGAELFAERCAICHGDGGQGQTVGERQVFPPLWGDGAYNWGAGMHRVNTAANFIKANMPLGQPYSLSDQQAWDLAAFINGHERPQDPRRRTLKSVDETDRIFHQHMGYYGDTVDGHRLGDHDDYGENPGAE
ncbi:c-type cytochrome [Halomonas organivorans]|uniref:Thiosulfate dehydrogenase n=1 Tax=Halomonas organivorans TaxID=257772 RepID=A0A7W5BZK3_9GAMM|nr:c-type cytochrome [Halomonas organivorans]MBB3142091.1 thiosulfate dehydrogenase [Halomonas organivorans]